MNKINKNNYEAYLLDYSEGNLTDNQQMELELFLIQHPELDVNLSDLALVVLSEESISFSNKNNLKKTETDLVSEGQFVAYVEGQLSAIEKTEIEKSCSKNPLLLKELALFQKTILAADSSITYPNKNKLKRKPKVIWFNFSVVKYAAAACVLFLVGLFILWPKPSSELNNSILANKTKTTNINSLPSNNGNHIQSSTNIDDQTTPEVLNQQVSSNRHHQTKFANHSFIDTDHVGLIKDTIRTAFDNQPIIELPKNETFIASNTSSVIKPLVPTIVQVIAENDDEIVVLNTNKKKKGIWATASRALKNLNHVGVKAVNGDEKEESSYALTLGELSITHKTGL